MINELHIYKAFKNIQRVSYTAYKETSEYCPTPLFMAEHIFKPMLRDRQYTRLQSFVNGDEWVDPINSQIPAFYNAWVRPFTGTLSALDQKHALFDIIELIHRWKQSLYIRCNKMHDHPKQLPLTLHDRMYLR